MSLRDIDAKTKTTLSLTLEIVLIISIALGSTLVVSPVRAEGGERSLQDGLHLMAVSQAILAGEIDEEVEYTKVNGAMAPDSRPLSASAEEQLLVAMINAVKSQIATLIKECNETRRLLVERNEECAVSTLDDICEEGKRELRNTLSLLHQVRGDKRKFFTRLTANLKRAGKSIWHAVGPVGRRILQSLGEEVVQMVKTPGGVKVRALRVIFRSRLKSLARKEIRSAIQRGAERLIMKKWEVARGPTGDQCGEAEVAAESQDGSQLDNKDWFDELWRNIEELLVADSKNCQKTAIGALRSCLLDKAASGESAEDAFNACEHLMKAIPKNDAGGSVNMTGQTELLDAVPNEVTITYPSAGGGVTGDIHLQRVFDVTGCTYTLTTKLAGQYDPSTCTMKGEATSELLYEGYCVSTCGSGESFDVSPTTCPVTLKVTTVWEATLEDGVLRGAVGDQSCERGCIGGFRAPGYGVNP